MAKNGMDRDLFDRLRAGGLRKRVAGAVAGAVGSARDGQASSHVSKVAADLRTLAAELEDRAKGGPAKREATAKKAAATRKRNAGKRSEAAKKGARTRARAKR